MTNPVESGHSSSGNGRSPGRARIGPSPGEEYVFSAVVGTARCAVRAPFEGRNVCMTCTCGVIGSARSDAGEDVPTLPDRY